MRPFYRFVHTLARIAFRLYGRWRIEGLERLPRSGPVIVAGNHVSYIDPPLVGAAIPREAAYMARHDLFQSRLMNWLLPRVGAFPVHRDSADRAALRTALQRLSEGKVLVLFPEGTRSHDGRMQPAEPGVALIVQRSGAPVVPAAVIGPERMWPPGQKRLKRVPLTVVFGDPMFFTPDTPREEVVAAIMRGIADLLTRHGRPMVAAEDRQRPASPSVP